jgi:hypothetical protein
VAFEGYGVKLALAPQEQGVTFEFEPEEDKDEDPAKDLYSHPSLFPRGAPDFE